MTNDDALQVASSWGIHLMVPGYSLQLIPLRDEGWAVYIQGAPLMDDEGKVLTNSFEGRTVGEALEGARERVYELLDGRPGDW